MPTPSPELELLLAARSVDLAGGTVLRALPQAQRRLIGPFVFLDHLGSTPSSAMGLSDVLSHPHIGLSTVTYLFEGALTHRDSLGVVQVIRPGDVNWMTAGSGVVHAEHLPPERGPLAGIQLWVALPRALEETAPSFVHYPAASLPLLEDGGARVRLLAGSMWGASSPVKTASALFYAEAQLATGATLQVPAAFVERGVYVVAGSVAVGSSTSTEARLAAGTAFSALGAPRHSVPSGALTRGQLAVLTPGAAVVLRALEPSRLLVFGGEPLDGARHIHWNFVSSSRERLEQAREDWRAHRFARVPGERRYLPLPGDGEGPQLYPNETP